MGGDGGKVLTTKLPRLAGRLKATSGWEGRIALRGADASIICLCFECIFWKSGILGSKVVTISTRSETPSLCLEVKRVDLLRDDTFSRMGPMNLEEYPLALRWPLKFIK